MFKVLTLMFIGVLAMVDSSTTYLGSMSAHTEKTILLKLPEGTTSIEVYNPYRDTKFTCSFTDVDTGLVGLDQKDVVRCNGNVHNKHPVNLEVKFTNLSDNEIDYRVIRTTSVK